jgi:hypothetical protein
VIADEQRAADAGEALFAAQRRSRPRGELARQAMTRLGGDEPLEKEALGGHGRSFYTTRRSAGARSRPRSRLSC